MDEYFARIIDRSDCSKLCDALFIFLACLIDEYGLPRLYKHALTIELICLLI